MTENSDRNVDPEGAGRTVPRGHVGTGLRTCQCGAVIMEDYAEAVMKDDVYHVNKPTIFFQNRKCRPIQQSDLMQLPD